MRAPLVQTSSTLVGIFKIASTGTLSKIWLKFVSSVIILGQASILWHSLVGEHDLLPPKYKSTIWFEHFISLKWIPNSKQDTACCIAGSSTGADDLQNFLKWGWKYTEWNSNLEADVVGFTLVFKKLALFIVVPEWLWQQEWRWKLEQLPDVNQWHMLPHPPW